MFNNRGLAKLQFTIGVAELDVQQFYPKRVSSQVEQIVC